MWSASCLQVRFSFSSLEAGAFGDRSGVPGAAVADREICRPDRSTCLVGAEVRAGDFKRLDELQTGAAVRSVVDAVGFQAAAIRHDDE